METISREALERAQSILGTNEQDTRAKRKNGFDVEAYLKHYGVEVVKVKQNGSSTLYCLKECVFDPAHTSNESAIGITSEGKEFYQCFHESCKDHRWRDARERISGADSLKPFMSTILSNSPYIYTPDRKDNKTTKDYQGFTEGGIQNPLDSNKPSFDPLAVLKKGSDLMALDIKVEWLVANLIPKQSITLLHGRGGIGKTWVTLTLAHAVSKGILFMGLETFQCPVVYVDYENSLPVLVERVKKIEAADVLYWHNTNEMRPPKIDAREWELYKTLPVGLLIYDTLRASQTKDENDSRQMADVMTRLKELRDVGFTILLLHHTPKGNDQTYKGSTAILDLADHVLSLHKVRKGSLEETDDEDSENVYYRFGTKHKTRYEPFHIFLEFQKEHGFVVAPDPDTEELEEIYDLLREEREPLKQSRFYDLVKTKLGISSKGKAIRLFNKGIGKYWETKRTEGRGRAVLYCPIVQPHIDKDSKTESKSDKTKPSETTLRSVDNTALSDCPAGIKTERTETGNDVFVRETETDIPKVKGEPWTF
ncbi:MAG TPA: AAA family ATPase [Syntrophorhabdaceae bacterium]|nr:AAA family ATPase [Syntrophorhabdaceae bacterium]